MSTSTAQFDELEAAMASGGVSSVLDLLVEQMRSQKKYYELFESLKMRTRSRLGLPLLYSDSGDDLEEPQRSQLEEGLLDACREVGLLLLKDGKIRDGWMYLRPVGDRRQAAEILAGVEVDDDNLEELIEVTLHEGVDVRRGFQLVLEHYGTCNAITTFESTMSQRTKEEQQMGAGLLVEHVHQDLLETVKADIAKQEGGDPPQSTLAELVDDRDWLFQDHSYHIDTTHLSSTVRFSRLLDEERLLRLALDLTAYGRQLSEQFQYQGEEPFADLYPSHSLYLQALLGQNVEEALAYFRQRAEMLDVASHGMAAIEVYIDLLARLGRYDEALRVSTELTPVDAQPIGFAPSLLDLSQGAGDFERLMRHCRDRDDLLGFATGLMYSESKPAD